MRTPLRALADTMLDEGVDHFVIDRRQAGKSWRAISLDLRDATDGQINVTPETVRSWYRDITEKAAVA